MIQNYKGSLLLVSYKLIFFQLDSHLFTL